MKQVLLKLFFISLGLCISNVSSGINVNSKLHLQRISKTSQIKDKRLYTSDATISLDSTITISGMSVSGVIDLGKNCDSYAIITMTDSKNTEHLVYETYQMLADTSFVVLDNSAYESALLDNVTPKCLNLYTHNASLRIDSIHYNDKDRVYQYGMKISRFIKEQSEEIVKTLNKNLEKRGALWRAGITSMSDKTYEDKKAMFGRRVPQLYGFEYYKGGIFVMPEMEKEGKNTKVLGFGDTNQYVNEWDWRYRHGKNWMTPVKDQLGCGSCWAFAAVGVLEAYINLYYNDTINYDLSEEEIISCSSYGCNGGFEQYAFDYVKTHGIVDEDCFLYVGYEKDCSLKCTNPSERIFIEDYGYYNTDVASMKQLLFKAPITVGLNTWFHSITIAGYKTINSGDIVFNGNSSSTNSITVNPYTHASLIGKTAWLIKNSWGTEWGDNGYGYFVIDESSINAHCYLEGKITSQILTDNDILCSDADGDGYYFWGLGNRPSNCPSWVPTNPDGDDSNYQYGPMNSYGNLENLELRALETLWVDTDYTFTSRSFWYNNTVVCSTAKLTIKSQITLYGSTKIIVEPNGELVIDGGILENADIELNVGSKLVLKNGGAIIMRNGKDFYSPVGAVVKIEEGTIK